MDQLGLLPACTDNKGSGIEPMVKVSLRPEQSLSLADSQHPAPVSVELLSQLEHFRWRLVATTTRAEDRQIVMQLELRRFALGLLHRLKSPRQTLRERHKPDISVALDLNPFVMCQE